MPEAIDRTLKKTPLDLLHREFKARMVSFADHTLPVQYAYGIIAEHTHTREKASLFDISHMGQITISGINVEKKLERLVPGDITGLAEGQIRYTMLTNAEGGIIDDLMVSKGVDHLRLVVNGARTEADLTHLRQRFGDNLTIEHKQGLALMALQGPSAVTVLSRLNSTVTNIPFMTFIDTELAGKAVSISRCGYTGEDGFEISTASEDAEELARTLLDQVEIKFAGLGARDSLRLEAGLCLYGQDIDETTSPLEAGLNWTINKKRLKGGRFLGAKTIQKQSKYGPKRRLVGLIPEGRAPARRGVAILDKDDNKVGNITSGGFGATFGGPLALGYVPNALSKSDTALRLKIRKSHVSATVKALPFVPHRYFSTKN